MMKSISFPAICFAVCLLLVTGCREEPLYINYTPSLSTYDTTYIDQSSASPDDKEVLLEDITGVKCKNCPKAAIIAKDLLRNHKGHLNVIAMQPLDFNKLLTWPFSIAGSDQYDSKYDYQTAAAAAIIDHVGKPNTLPSGYVDRKSYNSNGLILPREDWIERVGNQVLLPSPVNITLEATHADGKITIDVMLRYTATVAKEKKHNLSIAITQDSTIDVQDNDGVFDSAYVSMHLLRDMVTSYTGDVLLGSLVAGRTFKKRFVYAIKPTSFTYAPFVIRNMHVVAYVHEDAASGKQVIQSQETEIQE